MWVGSERCRAAEPHRCLAPAKPFAVVSQLKRVSKPSVRPVLGGPCQSLLLPRGRDGGQEEKQPCTDSRTRTAALATHDTKHSLRTIL